MIISERIKSSLSTRVQEKMMTLFNYFKRKEHSLPNPEGPLSLRVTGSATTCIS